MKDRVLNQNQQSQNDIHPSKGWLQRRAVRSLPSNENEVKPSVVGESGLHRNFVHVPVHGNRLPAVQRTAFSSASLPPFQQQLSQHPATETPSVSLGERVLQKKNEMTVNSQAPSEMSRPNQTGLPDRLKTGIENLSGYSMDDVRVHYNSDKPAQLQAHAYAQGTNIHIAPGQEKHLPHEAWHVVQQMQGRVKPIMQMKGTSINNDQALESEADIMGSKSLNTVYPTNFPSVSQKVSIENNRVASLVLQFGGTKWTSHKGREHIKKLGVSSGITAHYTKDGSGNFYVEGWIKGKTGGECAGEVQIVPGKTVALHTKSSESSRGGLGDKLMPLAMKTIAKNHRDGENVLLPMGGGAIIKLIIGKLSEIFGVPEIHKLSEDARKERKQKQEKELEEAATEEERKKIIEARKSGVSEFNPDFIVEHGRHLEALLDSDKGKRIQIISQVYVKIEPKDDSEMSIIEHLNRVIKQPAMQVILPMDLFIEFASAL